MIAVERLLVKLRQPASRAGELAALRRRLRAERSAAADDDERALARAVGEQKQAVSALLEAVASCGTCASGQPLPSGRYAGGACCSGVTAALFDDVELGALAHAGTRVRDLVPPVADHAGCAFRGPTGCTLALAHRPARCVHYVCNTLRRELHARGQLDALEAALAELDQRMQRYRAVNRARADREVLAPVIAAVAAAHRRSR